ncbi:MAG: RIP metalloprotease RseP [Limisphaerales bacterium]
MSQILNILYVSIVVLLLFGASIFVHEFGHFWVARKRGLKVEGFAIGFGPKVFSWVRDGIEYSVRWIPAGGYVKLPQMITSQQLEGSADSHIPPAPPFSKILVAIAGPVMNVIFAFLVAGIIYFVGLPEPVNPSIIGYVEPGSAEAKLGIQEGDRIVNVDGKPVNSWEQIREVTVFARTNVLPVSVVHEGKTNTYPLTAKVSDIGGKFLNLDPKEHPVITAFTDKDAPASKAGLKVDDEFVSFDGVPVVNQPALIEMIQERAGKPTECVVKRGDQKIKVTVTPEVNPDTKKGRIGVAMSLKFIYVLKKPGPSPVEQISTVWFRTIDTFNALFHSKQTGVGVKDLSGPPGIIAMLAAQVNTDFRLAMSFLVLLNINLAILNMLPIPVLDGGHILMAIVEKIRRRPLSVRFVEYTTTAFAVLLISFMLFVSFNDVTKRLPIFRAMFHHGATIEQQAQPEPTQQQPKAAPAH